MEHGSNTDLKNERAGNWSYYAKNAKKLGDEEISHEDTKKWNLS
jgi:hypothetical protein